MVFSPASDDMQNKRRRIRRGRDTHPQGGAEGGGGKRKETIGNGSDEDEKGDPRALKASMTFLRSIPIHNPCEEVA